MSKYVEQISINQGIATNNITNLIYFKQNILSMKTLFSYTSDNYEKKF